MTQMSYYADLRLAQKMPTLTENEIMKNIVRILR